MYESSAFRNITNSKLATIFVDFTDNNWSDDVSFLINIPMHFFMLIKKKNSLYIVWETFIRKCIVVSVHPFMIASNSTCFIFVLNINYFYGDENYRTIELLILCVMNQLPRVDVVYDAAMIHSNMLRPRPFQIITKENFRNGPYLCQMI